MHLAEAEKNSLFLKRGNKIRICWGKVFERKEICGARGFEVYFILITNIVNFTHFMAGIIWRDYHTNFVRD